MRFDFRTFFVFLSIFCIIYVAIALRGGDFGQVMKKGAMDFLRVFPILLISFLIASGILSLIPKGLVMQYMGSASGFKGLLIGCGMGILTPGSPVVDFPIALSLLKHGAGIGPIVAMLVAGKVWSLSMMPIEASVLGWPVTIVHYVSTFTAPFVAGFIAQFIWAILYKGVKF